MNNATTLTFRRGLGLFGFLFGSVFAGMPTLIAIGIITQSNDGAAAILPMLAFMSIFVIVGVSIALGRGVITIDKTLREVSSGWGLVVAFVKTKTALDDYSNVTLTREIRRSKNSTYTVYPVRLQGERESTRVTISEPRDFHESRRKAEQLAKFAELDIHDHTTSPTTVRAWDALDETLRERALRTGESRAIPDEPADTQVQTQYLGSQVELTLPPQGIGAQVAGSVVMGVVVIIMSLVGMTMLLAGLHSSNNASTSPATYLVVVAQAARVLGVAGGVFIAAAGVRGAFTRQRVVVSPDSLTLECPALIGSRSRSILSSELEELEIAQGQLRAVSDQGVLLFGRSLSAADREYVRGVILGVVG